MAELLAGVRKHIEHRLDEPAALRALTLRAAEILCVDDVLGSIEAGKVANIVLREPGADDRPISLETRVRHVFVDGLHFEVETAPAETRQIADNLRDAVEGVSVVQMIGRIVVLHRPFPEEPDEG